MADEVRAIEGATEIEVRDFREYGAPARIVLRLPSMSQLIRLARLEGVRWIEEVPEQDEDNGNTAGTMQSGTPGDEPVFDHGINGEGQIIGVIDSGPVDVDHCMFEDPAGNVPAPTHRKVLEVRGAGTNGHATFVAGIALGDDFNNPGSGANRGNAWAARLVSGRRGEGLLNALIANRAQGATIHTNSWHDDDHGPGNPAPYNQTASDADAFTWLFEDHLIFGSMGNNGEEQGAPGTSKNSVGINASRRDPNENTVGDGNPGPTLDGRRKPDMVTPGCQIRSATVNTACTIQLSGVCATSWATPAAAAAAALTRQYYSEGWYPTGTPQPVRAFFPTGSLIKATLLNATLDMTGHAGYPGNTEGWGLLRLENSLFLPGSARALRAWDRRHADGLATGEFSAFSVSVAAASEPLRVTLVWADFPGAAGAVNPVVNNLDLTVIAPDGTSFRGNVFAGGQSVTGGTADALNNVEQVLVPSPAIGTWTVRVAAPAVNVAVPAQGYAVVATAVMAAPQIQIPGDLDLGSTCVGSQAVDTLEVCNTGVDDLVVGPITSSSPRFAVTEPEGGGYPVTLVQGACFPFQVTFASLVPGPQSATLNVLSNDLETPSVLIGVSAEGTVQDISVSGSTDFGTASAWRPAVRTVEVCNVGACDLAATGASIDCPDFVFASNPLPTNLPAGTCVDVTVAFEPAIFGETSCQLTINSDDPDTPAVVLPLVGRTGPFISLNGGLVEPHGALGTTQRHGSTVRVGYLNPWKPKMAWGVTLGTSRFDGRTGQDDVEVWELDALFRFTVNPTMPARFFLTGGLGAWHFDAGDIEVGVDLGLGVTVPTGKRFAFEATYDYRSTFTVSPSLRWSRFQAGFLVSF